MLNKIEIRNYRGFKEFGVEFQDGVNILVGDNDAGKSTLLEAVSLALTARLGDRFLSSALSPHLFNQEAADAYIAAIDNGENPTPPEITIDLFLASDESTADLAGTNNLLAENSPGLRVRASFDQRFADEYAAFRDGEDPVRVVPTEYYKVDWLGFSGNPVTRRSVPVSASRIDASAIRLQSGADYYLQQIIQDHLSPVERAELSRAYRSLREQFSDAEAIEAINDKLALTESGITDGDLSLSIDISHRTAWETSRVAVHDAYDLTAEIFAAALESVRRFRDHGPGSALSWLIGIARNLTANFHRRGAMRRRAINRLQVQLAPLRDDELDALEQRIDAQRTTVLSDIARLPPQDQNAVRRYIVDGDGYDEIATDAEISSAAARKRVSRGLARLRELQDKGMAR